MRKAILAGVLLAIVPMQASALSTEDLLALVAMPLAVAAVADITGVPANELASLAATLNNADVPPPQFIEVIRYVPVALVVEDDEPNFVQFVQTQVDQGVRGPALVTVIERRLQTFEPAIVIAPQPAATTLIVDETFIPPVVRTRVARVHPHGGPPGQLKKQLGLKTGAEVVHRDKTPAAVPTMVSGTEDRGKVKVKEKDKGKGRGEGGGQGRGEGGGGGGGKGKGKGKGKG